MIMTHTQKSLHDSFIEWKTWFYSLTLFKKSAPLLGITFYWTCLRLLNGIRGDHFFIGTCLLILFYAGPKVHTFLRFLLPYILTFIIYDSQRFYADYLRLGTIHVKFPYFFDKTFFGISTQEGILTPGEWLQKNQHLFLDLLAGFAYLVFFLQYIGVSAYFYFYLSKKGTDKKSPSEVLSASSKMIWGFFWLNLLGYSTYYWFPAAPPWYVSLYGLGPARMDVQASSAGCIRFDQILGTHFFSEMYGRSADVFGSIPSLHIAYPFLAIYYAFKFAKLRVFCIFFYFLMCFSAVYLNHHYIIDILWGTGYSLLIALGNDFILEKNVLKSRLKHLLLFIFYIFLYSSQECFGKECFDFSKKLTAPLPPLLKESIFLDSLDEKTDLIARGETQDQLPWGAARGIINQPIELLLEKLLDPKTIKGEKNKNLTVIKKKQKDYFAFQMVKMEIYPIPFIRISWEEEWVYSLMEGTKKEPEKILIAYQKSSFNNHIEHFCGCIVLKKKSKNISEISFYEELKATRRSSQDIINGHLGTLKTLRQ